MKNISVRVDDDLYRDVRRRSFDTGVTLTEVVQHLLTAYVAGKVRVETGLRGEEPHTQSGMDGRVPVAAGSSPPSPEAETERGVTGEAKGVGRIPPDVPGRRDTGEGRTDLASRSLDVPRSASASKTGPAEMRVSPPVEGAARGGPRDGASPKPSRNTCPMDTPKGVKCKFCGSVHDDSEAKRRHP